MQQSMSVQLKRKAPRRWSQKVALFCAAILTAFTGITASGASVVSASSIDVSGLSLEFTNADDIGALAEVGNSFRYEDVVTVG